MSHYMQTLTPFEDVSLAIKTRRNKSLIKEDNKKVLGSILKTLFLLLIAVVSFMYFFEFKVVSGNYMFPALSDGDLALSNKRNEYSKNDVVFYTIDEEEYVGRIVAKAGDMLDMTEDGTLLVNGTVQSKEIVYPTYPPENWEGRLIVPDGQVFILGDYRTQTVDSRNLGCINIDNISSRIITVIRHRGI